MITWNKREIDILREQYSNTTYTVSEIAKTLKTTELSIRNKAIRLGITRGIKRWKEEYADFLIRHYRAKGPKWCGEQLGYKTDTMIARAYKLGLTTCFGKWSEEDIVVLTELVNLHQPLSKIAVSLNKSIEQVKNKMQKLGLQANHWSEEEITILKEKYISTNADELVELLKRDKSSIFSKAYHLGLTNPNWGYIEDKHDYPKEWNDELKKKILTRDNYTCQLCSRDRNYIVLCVHHIDYDKNNNNPSNVITLCFACHAKTNVHRQYWISFFNTFRSANETS